MTRGLAIAWWLVCVALASGCGPTLGVRARLALRASETLGCDPAFAQVSQLTENAFEVRACGHIVELTDTNEGSGRTWVEMPTAASLASASLGCPYSQMTMDRVSPISRSFRGCGRAATFALSCSAVGGCNWIDTTPSSGLVVSQ